MNKSILAHITTFSVLQSISSTYVRLLCANRKSPALAPPSPFYICSLMEMKPYIVTNGASLQRELSKTHFERVGVRMQVMKKGEQDIEHGYHRSQMCLDRRPKPVIDALEVAHDGHHRQGRFDTHALIPGGNKREERAGFRAKSRCGMLRVRTNYSCVSVSLEQRRKSL
jgi:hypothetical protein